ncbi:MAG: hypothetical protein GYB33_00655 [Gammaproteobacteria bacterium]|nr:hypothetical protein [Gammaproteobacteria bacterium]
MLSTVTACGVVETTPAESQALAQKSSVDAGRVEAVDMVWSAHRAFFDYAGKGEHQVIAYYDASRQMSVAHRASPRQPWRFHKLPSYLGWDSHNNVVVGIDEAGYIHVSGNMHNDALVYFRSASVMDVRSLEQVPTMVGGEAERHVTYPHFFNGADGRLYFKHRFGSSGNGVELYKVFDTQALQWRQLHDTAFVDGEGERNGYFVGPTLEHDGMFHLAWVWRETPLASTNHHLSYARSRDLLNWEASDGTPLTLPIRLDSAEIVDPIQIGGGLLNGQTPVALDSKNRPMIVYQKYGPDGNSQVFLSRREGAGWKTVQVSNFRDYRAELDRQGALALDLDTKAPPFVDANNNIVVPANFRGDDLEYLLDPETLNLREKRIVDRFPRSVKADDLDNGIPLHIRPLNIAGQASREWFIAWEALPPNRDKARTSITSPTTLRVHYVPLN